MYKMVSTKKPFIIFAMSAEFFYDNLHAAWITLLWLLKVVGGRKSNVFPHNK